MLVYDLRTFGSSRSHHFIDHFKLFFSNNRRTIRISTRKHEFDEVIVSHHTKHRGDVDVFGEIHIGSVSCTPVGGRYLGE